MKNNHAKGQRLGAMTTHRRREKEPSYSRFLLRFGFTTKLYSLQSAWHVWQLVCSDAEVIKLSTALAAKKKPVHMVSVAEPFKNCAAVLTAMSEAQLAALKQRVGVHP